MSVTVPRFTYDCWSCGIPHDMEETVYDDLESATLALQLACVKEGRIVEVLT